MGATRAPIATRGVDPRGQAATETMIMMMFLLLMIFGLVHLCMLMSVKFMVNNAAFSAARTAMIAPNDATAAAEEGLGWMRGWWRGAYSGLNTPYVQGPVNKTIRGKNRNGYRATFAVPFGVPSSTRRSPAGSPTRRTAACAWSAFRRTPVNPTSPIEETTIERPLA